MHLPVPPHVLFYLHTTTLTLPVLGVLARQPQPRPIALKDGGRTRGLPKYKLSAIQGLADHGSWQLYHSKAVEFKQVLPDLEWSLVGMVDPSFCAVEYCRNVNYGRPCLLTDTTIPARATRTTTLHLRARTDVRTENQITSACRTRVRMIWAAKGGSTCSTTSERTATSNRRPKFNGRHKSCWTIWVEGT